MSAEPVSYELGDFELEMLLASGWSVVRADEHPVAARVLRDREAVRRMLTGMEIEVIHGQNLTNAGQRWRCRLTPKTWLTKHLTHSSANHQC